MTDPDWLVRRGGSVKLGSDGRTRFVFMDQRPSYSLVAVPVAGNFGCVIRQTINGKRIESTQTAATTEEAVTAGLEDLRKALGW